MNWVEVLDEALAAPPVCPVFSALPGWVIRAFQGMAVAGEDNGGRGETPCTLRRNNWFVSRWTPAFLGPFPGTRRQQGLVLLPQQRRNRHNPQLTAMAQVLETRPGDLLVGLLTPEEDRVYAAV